MTTKPDYSIPLTTLDCALDFSEVPAVEDPEPEHSSIHYNLRMLSYSGRLTLRSCPRKYELNKLSVGARRDEDAAGHLIFGSVVGNGIQTYLVTGSLDLAIFRCYLDWNSFLDDEAGLRSKKTFWHAIQAIQKFVLVKQSVLAQYDVASFNGRPAIELGFRIKCPSGFDYRGKLDALLIHRHTKEFLVLECKTTGYNQVDAAMYGNSDQAIGYGIVIDAVAHWMSRDSTNSYKVLYPVYKTKSAEWEPFLFDKSNNQRALWLQALLLETQQISTYNQIGHFPTYGESCYSFGRQCSYFGMCQMSNKHLIPEDVPIVLDREGDYPLVFTLEELIQAQLEKQ